MNSRTKLTVLVGSVVLLTALLALGLATVSAASVNLSIEKQVIGLPHLRGFAIAGEELIYEIRIDNYPANGTDGNVIVSDTLPSEVTYLGATAACELEDDTLTCNLGQMADGEYSRIIEVKVLVNPDAVEDEPDGTAVLVNSARVDAPDDTETDLSDNAVEFSIFVEDSADLSVVKMSKPDIEVGAGELFTYTIFVENLGPSYARNVSIRDEILSSGAFTLVGGVRDDPNRDYDACWVAPGGGIPEGPGETIECHLNEPLEPKGIAGEGRWIIQVVVQANQAQDVNNLVNVFSGDVDPTGLPSIPTPDPDLLNNTAQDFIYVTAVADLGLTKSVLHPPPPPPPPDFYAGNKVLFHLQVTNNGPSTAENVVLEDMLAEGLTVLNVNASQGSCTTGDPGSEPLRCNLGSLAFGASATVGVTARIDAAYMGVLENDAWVYSDLFDDNNSNNRASVIVPVQTRANLTLAKIARPPSPWFAGEIRTYEYRIENQGPSVSRDVRLRDFLPTQVDFMSAYAFKEGSTGGIPLPCNVSAPNVLICPLGDIPPTVPPGVVVLVDVRIKPEVPDGTAITNDAALTSDTPGSSAAVDFVVVWIANRADLSITKTSEPMKIYPGEQKVYHIEVTNNGPSDAPGVIVTDTLPVSVTYEIDTDDCLQVGDTNTYTCTLGTIPAGETKGFDISALVSRDAPPGEITNTAVVSMPYDTNLDNNTAWATNLVLDANAADLGIQKWWGQAPPQWFEGAPFASEDCYLYDDSLNLYGLRAGCPLTFSLTVKNTGPLLAENVVVEDALPAGVTVEGVGSSQGSCTTGIPGDPSAPLTCNLGNIPRDEGAGIEVFVTTDADLAWEMLENDAVVSSDIPDPDNGNNRAHVLIWVEPFSYLSLVKHGPENPAEVTAGEEIHYGIEINNMGPSTAHDVYLNDMLPGDVWLVGAEVMVGEGSCEPDTALCSLGDMEPGGHRSVQVRGYVNPWLKEGEVITNTVEAWAHTSPFTFTIPITPSVETLVLSRADLSIRKTSDPYKVYAGEQKRYDIEVTNHGPSVARNVLVTDTLPSGVEFELATIGCDPVPGVMLGASQPNEGGELFSVDLGTGAGSFIGDMPDEELAAEIEYDNATGRLFAAQGFKPWYGDTQPPRLYELDPTTGAEIGYVDLSEDCALPGLEFVDGTLYGACNYLKPSDDGYSYLVTVDPDNGDVYEIGEGPMFDEGNGLIHGLAWDEAERIMYGLAVWDGGNGLATIDLDSGQAEYLCDIYDDDYSEYAYDLRAIEFGPDGQLYGGIAEDSDLVIIDPTPQEDNGQYCSMHHVGDTGYSVTGLTLMGGSEAVCHLGDIPPGETAAFSIWARVKPDTLGMINNRVDVFSDSDPNPDNDWDTEANLVLGKADLKVTKFGKPDGEVRAGEELEYWVVVDNLGPGFAHDVVLYDLISSDGHFRVWWGEHERDGDGDGEEYSCQVSGSDCHCWEDGCWCREDASLTCRLNHPLPVMTPASPGRWLLKVWVEAQEEQSINNLARVVSSDYDPDLSNNEAIAEHEITAVADLDLEKEASGEVLVGCEGETQYWEDEVAAGGELEYTLHIENEGPSEAENVVVEDWGLSPFLDIVDVECEKDDSWRQCSCNLSGLGELGDTNRHLVCYLGTIEEDDEDHIIITARIPSDVPEGTRLVNDARVYSDVFDDDNGDNLDYNWTYVTVTADLGVEKSQEPETTLPGLEVIYTIVVTNTGPSDAHGVLISDTLPFNATSLTVEGCASDGGQCDVPCEVPTCPAGECPWPDVDFVAQANIPAGEHVIYTLTAIPEWVPCEPITNTAEVGFAKGFDDIDPCWENDKDWTTSDPECNFVPLVLKAYPGPDSPP